MSVKHSLLVLLAEQPRTASQLRQAFESDMGGFFTLNIGQVAQTLSRLERDGLITHNGTVIADNGREADLYAITDEGNQEVESWWSSSVFKPANNRDELVIKVALAARRDGAHRTLVSLLDAQRFSTLRQIREVSEEADSLPQERVAQRLSAERRIFELEAILRWLDRVESLSAPSVNASSSSTPTQEA